LFRYLCRYCQQELGTLDSSKVTESQLGLDRLTPDERKDIITNDANGICQIYVTCEYCQQVLSENPERILLPYLYH
jgi:hypothetical protein